MRWIYACLLYTSRCVYETASKLLEVINNPNESSEEAKSSLPEDSVSSSEESVSEAVAE